MVVSTVKAEMLKFKSSTTPNNQRVKNQNWNVLSLRKVAITMTIVITLLEPGVLAKEKRVFATSRWNKLQVKPKILHTSTNESGTGKDAVGKSGGQGVLARTKIAMKGRLCGPYQIVTKMLAGIKHLETEPTSRQRILPRVKRKHPTQLKILPNTQQPTVPINTRQNIQFKINWKKRKKKFELSLISHIINEVVSD